MDNICNMIFYPIDLLIYFEKHKLFEIIFRLTCDIARDRPKNVRRYAADRIQQIARSVNGNAILLRTPAAFDKHRLAKEFQSLFGTAIIVEANTSVTNRQKILDSITDYPKRNEFKKKNLIILDSQSAADACRDTVEMIRLAPAPVHGEHKTQILHLNTDRHLESKTVQAVYREFCPRSFVASGRGGAAVKLRIFLVERRGSGRKTQAAILAKDFGLIYVDMEVIVRQCLQLPTVLGARVRTELANSDFSAATIAAVLADRLLRPDCVAHGWIVVGFPNTPQDLQCFAASIVPPNLIVFLHTGERVCHQRIAKLNATKLGAGKDASQDVPVGNPRDCVPHVQMQMAFYKDNVAEILDYCKTTGMHVLHVDGSRSVGTVKNSLCGKLIAKFDANK